MSVVTWRCGGSRCRFIGREDGTLLLGAPVSHLAGSIFVLPSNLVSSWLANQAQHHGFRVILGDANRICGHRIKRFEENSLSREQLAQLVRRNFELSDFDGGAEVKGAAETRPVADLLLLVGHDGPRRVQIKTDDDLNAFFSTSFQHTALPSIEVQLALVMKLKRRKVKDTMRQKWLYKMEQIAVENRELRSKWDRTVERLEELERARQRDLKDVKKLRSSTNGQLSGSSQRGGTASRRGSSLCRSWSRKTSRTTSPNASAPSMPWAASSRISGTSARGRSKWSSKG